MSLLYDYGWKTSMGKIGLGKWVWFWLWLYEYDYDYGYGYGKLWVSMTMGIIRVWMTITLSMTMPMNMTMIEWVLQSNRWIQIKRAPLKEYAGTATSAGLSFVETFLYSCFMYALIPVPCYGTEFEITCQVSISVHWVKNSWLVETFKKRILHLYQRYFDDVRKVTLMSI